METVKQINNHQIFLETIKTSFFLYIYIYKTTDISYKSGELVNRLFLRTLCMTENVQTRVWVNNITTFTVINVHWEGGDHTSPWNEVHAAGKLNTFDLNVQNKPTSSEWNSVTVFFNLRTSNLGRHERYCYLLNSNTDTTSLTCPGAAMVGIFDAT